jgi:hypothetical protein
VAIAGSQEPSSAHNSPLRSIATGDAVQGVARRILDTWSGDTGVPVACRLRVRIDLECQFAEHNLAGNLAKMREKSPAIGLADATQVTTTQL